MLVPFGTKRNGCVAFQFHANRAVKINVEVYTAPWRQATVRC
jgi:hypothetical protein